MSDYQGMFRDALASCPAELTQAGKSRRRDMLAALEGAVVARRRRRVAVRLSGAALVIAAVAALLVRPGDSPRPSGQQNIATAPAPLEHIEFSVVRNQPGIVARIAVPRAPLPPGISAGRR